MAKVVETQDAKVMARTVRANADHWRMRMRIELCEPLEGRRNMKKEKPYFGRESSD